MADEEYYNATSRGGQAVAMPPARAERVDTGARADMLPG
jgi:hypothetical protein